MELPKKHPLGRKFHSARAEKVYFERIKQIRPRPFFIEDIRDNKLDQITRIDLESLIKQYGQSELISPVAFYSESIDVLQIICDQIATAEPLFAAGSELFKEHARRALGWNLEYENAWRAQEGQWEGTYSPFFAHWVSTFLVYVDGPRPGNSFVPSIAEKAFIEKYRYLHHKLAQSRSKRYPLEYGPGSVLKDLEEAIRTCPKNTARYQELIGIKQSILAQIGVNRAS